MNGVDPSPQDVTLQDRLFSGHRVKVFLYNQQVTDSLTAVAPGRRHSRTGSRSSGSTRRCPVPATTTSPGCWPRSTRCSGRWPTGVDRETAMSAELVLATETPRTRSASRASRVRLGGRTVLDDVSFSIARRRVHRPDRRQRRRQDDPVPGDPRPAGARSRDACEWPRTGTGNRSGATSATCRRSSCSTPTCRCAAATWSGSGSTATGSGLPLPSRARRALRRGDARRGRRARRSPTPGSDSSRAASSSGS